MDGKTRPVILDPAVDPLDALVADQVALLADGVPKRGLQTRGVDDRHVPAADELGMRDMELAGPVAALAADRVALEDRRPIPVERAADHRLDPVGVAEQACGLDRSVEMVSSSLS